MVAFSGCLKPLEINEITRASTMRRLQMAVRIHKIRAGHAEISKNKRSLGERPRLFPRFLNRSEIE